MKRLVLLMSLVWMMLGTVAAFAKEAQLASPPYEPKLAVVMLNAADDPNSAAKLLAAHRDFFTQRGYQVTDDKVVVEAVSKFGIVFKNPQSYEDLWKLGRELGVQNIVAFRGTIENGIGFNFIIPRRKSKVTLEAVVIGTNDIELAFTHEAQKVKTTSDSGSCLRDMFAIMDFPAGYVIAVSTQASTGKLQGKAMEEALQEVYGQFVDTQLVLAKMLGPTPATF